jgi:hypothetical protein
VPRATLPGGELDEARGTLGETREILARTDAGVSGRWPRAAAALCRTAIEQAVRTLWTGPNDCLTRCSGKVQMLCLSEFLEDEHFDLSLRTHLAWASLSNALHVDAGYELAPTATELALWCDLADELLLAIERSGSAP